jgi:hypothetical protein
MLTYARHWRRSGWTGTVSNCATCGMAAPPRLVMDRRREPTVRRRATRPWLPAGAIGSAPIVRRPPAAGSLTERTPAFVIHVVGDDGRIAPWRLRCHGASRQRSPEQRRCRASWLPAKVCSAHAPCSVRRCGGHTSKCIPRTVHPSNARSRPAIPVGRRGASSPQPGERGVSRNARLLTDAVAGCAAVPTATRRMRACAGAADQRRFPPARR